VRDRRGTRQRRSWDDGHRTRSSGAALLGCDSGWDSAGTRRTPPAQEDHHRSFGDRSHHAGDGDAGVVEREAEHRHDPERERVARAVDTWANTVRSEPRSTHQRYAASTARATRQKKTGASGPTSRRFSDALRRSTRVAPPKSVPASRRTCPRGCAGRAAATGRLRPRRARRRRARPRAPTPCATATGDRGGASRAARTRAPPRPQPPKSLAPERARPSRSP